MSEPEFGVIEDVLDQDLNTVCRICLKSYGVISIFSEDESIAEFTLRERIMSFAHVQIIESDGLPSKICRLCLIQINRAFELKAQCEYADIVLRQQLCILKKKVIKNAEEVVTEETSEDVVGEGIVEESDFEIDRDDFDALEDVEESGAKDNVEDFTVKGLGAKGVVDDITLNSPKLSDKDIIKEVKFCIDSESGTKEINFIVSKPSGTFEALNSMSSNTEIVNNLSQDINHTPPLRPQKVPNRPNYRVGQYCKTIDSNSNKVEVRFTNGNGEEVQKEVFLCPVCHKAYFTVGLFTRHLNKDHKPTGEFSCNYCGKLFFHELLLTMHVVESHIAEKPYCCRICGNSYKDEVSLKLHEKRHKYARKKLLCPHCGKTHCIDSYHLCPLVNKNRERKHLCDICGNKYITERSLTIHKARHLPVFRCNTCFETFTEKSNLERHTNKVHLDIRPYPCDVEGCKYAGYSQNDTTRHKMYHGVGRFKCDVCDKSFKTSTHLNNHKPVHTGERPFECNVCSKTFIFANSLRGHVQKVHLGIRPKRSKPNRSDMSKNNQPHVPKKSTIFLGEEDIEMTSEPVDFDED